MAETMTANEACRAAILAFGLEKCYGYMKVEEWLEKNRPGLTLPKTTLTNTLSRLRRTLYEKRNQSADYLAWCEAIKTDDSIGNFECSPAYLAWERDWLAGKTTEDFQPNPNPERGATTKPNREREAVREALAELPGNPSPQTIGKHILKKHNIDLTNGIIGRIKNCIIREQRESEIEPAIRKILDQFGDNCHPAVIARHVSNFGPRIPISENMAAMYQEQILKGRTSAPSNPNPERGATMAKTKKKAPEFTDEKHGNYRECGKCHKWYFPRKKDCPNCHEPNPAYSKTSGKPKAGKLVPAVKDRSAEPSTNGTAEITAIGKGATVEDRIKIAQHYGRCLDKATDLLATCSWDTEFALGLLKQLIQDHEHNRS